MSVPPVLTKGLPDPASAAPIASIARRSEAAGREVVARERDFVPEGEVDDAVRGGGCRGEPIEVVQIPAVDVRAGERERVGGRV